jgi:hypothetical protein
MNEGVKNGMKEENKEKRMKKKQRMVERLVFIFLVHFEHRAHKRRSIRNKKDGAIEQSICRCSHWSVSASPHAILDVSQEIEPLEMLLHRTSPCTVLKGEPL